MSDDHRTLRIYCWIGFAIFLWSGINPQDRIIWLLNTIPALLLVLGLTLTVRRFRFSNFTYLFVLVHVAILLIGSHYSYQLNPFFEYLRGLLDLSRNHFDRVGHFMQGLTPALLSRELLIINGHMKRSPMLTFTTLSISLGVSAIYEMLEAAFTLLSGYPAEMIMAYQGDLLDTQWDMFMALLGSLSARYLLGTLHEKHLAIMEQKRTGP